jgi:1,4-dihydroxy-2-naphthoate octaprenyltransferase
MMLCINLEATSYSNMDNRANSNSSTLGVQILYSSMMLGIMVFVTSPLNDVADVVVDKVTGRKTIPIVIGSENSIKMAIILAGAMIVLS